MLYSPRHYGFIGFFCYALNDKTSFEYMKEKAPQWIENRLEGSKTVVYFIGLKSDLLKEVDHIEILEFSKLFSKKFQEFLHGEVEILEISSKNNSNIVDLFISAYHKYCEFENKKLPIQQKEKCIIN